MSTSTTKRVTLSQVEPPHARSSADLQATAARVVVRDAGVEIHGYVVAREGNHVSVVWAVASGRHRQRTFSAETVFMPGHDHRWDGYIIPFEKLAVIRLAAR